MNDEQLIPGHKVEKTNYIKVDPESKKELYQIFLADGEYYFKIRAYSLEFAHREIEMYLEKLIKELENKSDKISLLKYDNIEVLWGEIDLAQRALGEIRKADPNPKEEKTEKEKKVEEENSKALVATKYLTITDQGGKVHIPRSNGKNTFGVEIAEDSKIVSYKRVIWKMPTKTLVDTCLVPQLGLFLEINFGLTLTGDFSGAYKPNHNEMITLTGGITLAGSLGIEVSIAKLLALTLKINPKISASVSAFMTEDKNIGFKSFKLPLEIGAQGVLGPTQEAKDILSVLGQAPAISSLEVVVDILPPTKLFILEYNKGKWSFDLESYDSIKAAIEKAGQEQMNKLMRLIKNIKKFIEDAVDNAIDFAGDVVDEVIDALEYGWNEFFGEEEKKEVVVKRIKTQAEKNTDKLRKVMKSVRDRGYDNPAFISKFAQATTEEGRYRIICHLTAEEPKIVELIKSYGRANKGGGKGDAQKDYEEQLNFADGGIGAILEELESESGGRWGSENIKTNHIDYTLPIISADPGEKISGTLRHYMGTHKNARIKNIKSSVGLYCNNVMIDSRAFNINEIVLDENGKGVEKADRPFSFVIPKDGRHSSKETVWELRTFIDIDGGLYDTKATYTVNVRKQYPKITKTYYKLSFKLHSRKKQKMEIFFDTFLPKGFEYKGLSASLQYTSVVHKRFIDFYDQPVIFEVDSSTPSPSSMFISLPSKKVLREHAKQIVPSGDAHYKWRVLMRLNYNGGSAPDEIINIDLIW